MTMRHDPFRAIDSACQEMLSEKQKHNLSERQIASLASRIAAAHGCSAAHLQLPGDLQLWVRAFTRTISPQRLRLAEYYFDNDDISLAERTLEDTGEKGSRDFFLKEHKDIVRLLKAGHSVPN